jgi:hypothetical protein
MWKICLYIFVLTVISACKEKYDLPFAGPAAGYLVIDGVINGGEGPTTIRLTRSLGLVDTEPFRYVNGATVRIEGEDNSYQTLLPAPDGIYHSPQLHFTDGIKYRLYILTPDGKEYASDYITPLKTPDIDTLTWERNDAGVTLYVNTHDPQNKTIYYRWEYEETWEIHSAFYSTLVWQTYPNGNPYDVDPRDPLESELMYTCWRNQNSSVLLLGSSAKLTRDTIHLPFMLIRPGDERLSVLYSINVTQYAVSKDGYEFLQRMKKNTEQVGSLFDAQPSELVGNVKCLTDPDETVIGFVEIAEAKQKRLWIRRSEVSPWNYLPACSENTVVNDPDSLELFAAYLPTQVHKTSPGGDTLSVYVATPVCVDCRLRGTPVKPAFWP